uniref:Nudix hydrolase domain-containing protein n=1 Tax=Timema douglasi TaxID=61478 RepID=A0A7R8VLQ3_TIMDO|nr:unnamed protein product [Timema douglasi]
MAWQIAVYYASIPSCDQTTHIDTDKYPSKLGITIELCAGIVDKELPLEEIASIEILEECGYDVPASKLETITTYRQVLLGTAVEFNTTSALANYATEAGIGTSGDKQTMFYVEVTDQMKIGSGKLFILFQQGGGNPKEGELIEVVEMSISEATSYMAQDEVKSPGGFMFALMWKSNASRSPPIPSTGPKCALSNGPLSMYPAGRLENHSLGALLGQGCSRSLTSADSVSVSHTSMTSVSIKSLQYRATGVDQISLRSTATSIRSHTSQRRT